MNFKIFFLVGLICSTIISYAQTGPLSNKIFHVNGNKDNPVNGTIQPNQEKNDVVITTDGNIGIGIINPTNKVDIRNQGQTTTGLVLQQGAKDGMVLISDKEGNATWALAEYKSRTVVYSVSGTYNVVGSINNMGKYTQFGNVKMDEVKSIFGNTYGWDITKQQYIVPIKGIYRISLTMYLSPGVASDYYKIGISKGIAATTLMPNMSYIALTSEGQNKTGFCTGLVILNKDDVLEVKGGNVTNTSNPIKIKGGNEYSTMMIELVKQLR